MPRSPRPLLVVALGCALSVALPSLATVGHAREDVAVPAPLVPWVDWVLHGEERRACPLGGGEAARICAWPGRLELTLGPHGGRFAQTWEMQAEDWVPLPGGAGAWPQQVRAKETALVVVERDGRPAVRLGPGTHPLSGDFTWRQLPEVLAVPRETGLLALHLDGEPVAQPRIDSHGRLWLGQRPRGEASGAEPDRLALEVMRRIDDDIPLRVRTRLALDVSGQPREVTLGPVTLPGGLPLRLESPLPARLQPLPSVAPTAAPAEGTETRPRTAGWMLQAQLRPGRWVLTVDSQHPGPIAALTLDARPAPWPPQEVWAFAAHPDLRQVEVRGGETIDPRQTLLPDAWQQLPTFLMRPGETLTLAPLHRGALGADRLHLQRALRLDYAGDAFSVRDRLTGQLAQGWRLEAEPILQLGQVQVDGEPRVITRLETDAAPARAGVEVRPGQLDLVADARIASGPVGFAVTLPASGWALPLEGIEAQLHLPPGWDLLAVGAVDNLPNSWLARWSLLDLFLVLIIALGTGRLWGWPWGLLALATLTLVWPEPGAPRWVWLHVLVAAALLRLLPDAPARSAFRVIRRLVLLYSRGALLAFAVIALPFLVTQMRDGLFPQLARPDQDAPAKLAADLAGAAAFSQQSLSDAERTRDEMMPAAPPARSAPSPEAPAEPLPALVPGALVQTGAGVPDWTWRSFRLSWTGPVVPGQPLRLWLLPPAAALLLAVLRVLLVLALGLRLADRLGLAGLGPSSARNAKAGGAALLVAGGLLLLPGGAAQAEAAAGIEASPGAADRIAPGEPAAFPPAELLDALKRRLLEPPACLPRCAEIPRILIEVTPSALRLSLDVDAAAPIALPLPGSADGWTPTEVTRDGTPVTGLRRNAAGVLAAPLPAGRHRVLLAGPLPEAEQVTIPLPLRPRLAEARVAAPWGLEGIDADGQPGDQLRLLRAPITPAPDNSSPDSPAPAAAEPTGLPPLLRVTRTLRFGLNWSLDTAVERLSPAETAVTLRVPLVPGEAVTTPGLEVDDGGLLISLPPGRTGLTWSSTLTPVDRLTLIAADAPYLTEVWRLEVSPVWHLTVDGIPPVHRLDAAERWLPTWRPWPGERLELRLARPVAVPGPTLTLDRSLYRLTPGHRASEATLELGLRSSQGGRHRIYLPAGAELLSLIVDGGQRPLALLGRALDLPLVPGAQQILVSWREPTPLPALYRPAAVALGLPGVNAETQIELGRDRWLLWAAGPGVGPAVLFWAFLLVLVPAAALLARSPLTPLGFSGWLLLGIGLSQAGAWAAALVTLWLFALGLRRRLDADTPPLWFNLVQIGLALLTLAALAALLVSVQQGLLGDPAMQVAGNGSSATDLSWYLDRQGPQTTTVTVISVPIWVYRALMLAWALWLAWRLLDWLRWGWQGFAEPALWRQRGRKAQMAPSPGDRTLPAEQEPMLDL